MTKSYLSRKYIVIQNTTSLSPPSIKPYRINESFCSSSKSITAICCTQRKLPILFFSNFYLELLQSANGMCHG